MSHMAGNYWQIMALTFRYNKFYMETSEFSFKAGKYKRFKIALVKIPGQKKTKQENKIL